MVVTAELPVCALQRPDCCARLPRWPAAHPLSAQVLALQCSLAGVVQWVAEWRRAAACARRAEVQAVPLAAQQLQELAPGCLPAQELQSKTGLYQRSMYARVCGLAELAPVVSCAASSSSSEVNVKSMGSGAMLGCW